MHACTYERRTRGYSANRYGHNWTACKVFGVHGFSVKRVIAGASARRAVEPPSSRTSSRRPHRAAIVTCRTHYEPERSPGSGMIVLYE